LQIAPNHYFRAKTWWPGDLYTVNEVGSKLKIRMLLKRATGYALDRTLTIKCLTIELLYFNFK
jgi:hypothetical protein